jgi:Bax protein
MKRPEKSPMWARPESVFSLCRRALAVVLSLVVLMSCDTTTKDTGALVKIESTRALAEYFDAIGFNVAANPEILQAVPRIRFTHIPRNWDQETTVDLKKSVFFRAMASAILQANERILTNRARLLGLDLDRLSTEDSDWLARMMQKYKVSDKPAGFTPEDMSRLTRRMDAIPPSLALVQAAIESGWGSSRFAREGNALFGQWTTGEGIKAEESEARLAAFTAPRDSVAAYCLNLNTHRSYRHFRRAREALRQTGKPLEGLELANYLDRYSEKGLEYTNLLKRMIQKDGLTIADTARLAQGPEIVIHPVSTN